MQVRITRDVRDGSVVAQLALVSETPTEKVQRKAFGSFAVSVGGGIEFGEVSFMLPEKDIRLPDDFPIIQSFSVEELTLATATERAVAFIGDISYRITQAKDAWLANDLEANQSTTEVSL